MRMFHRMNTTASALTSQRLRMDVISSNMANADTTRSEYVNGEWRPIEENRSFYKAKKTEDFQIFCKKQWANPIMKVMGFKSLKL